MGLNAPLATAKQSIVAREGFLLALRDTDGLIGVGEAAPLPKFGTESLSEAAETLQQLSRRSLPGVPANLQEIPAWLSSCGISAFITPAVSFGFECALAALVCSRMNIPLHTALASSAASSLQVNSVLSAPSAKELVAKAHAAMNSGATTLKIKVGAESVTEDIERLRLLRDSFPAMVLRADANAAWSYSDAKLFCSGVSGLDMQYIEDPLAHSHPLSLKTLGHDYGINFAIDEAARDDLWKLTRIGNLVYGVLIVKPIVTGIFTRTPELSAAAREKKLKIVYTSLLETSVGLSYVANIAAAQGESQFAHGIDTAFLLSADTLQEPLTSSSGVINVPDVRTIHFQLLPTFRRTLSLE